LGRPAPIDTSTKALTVELADATLAEIVNITPGAGVGEFTFDFNTLATGIVDGAFVADSDMTPAGELELRVSFSLAITNEPATGGTVTLSGGVDKP